MILGSVWFSIGAVLLALAWLYGRGAEAIPATVNLDPGLVSAAPRAGVTGVVAVVAGLGQLTAGFAATRQPGPWAARLGALLALVGAAVVGNWLLGGLSEARPVLVLLPALVTYAYVAWALLFENRVASVAPSRG
jgi:hypothetical protein